MASYWQSLTYFFKLPFHIQWRTFLIQLPRYVPLSILHLTSPLGPHPFVLALPSRKSHAIPVYVYVPPESALRRHDEDHGLGAAGACRVPVLLDFHGGGFIMGSPLEQAPYCSMMSRELGAVVLSVSYRIGPFSQFPAAIHDAEDVLEAILDADGDTMAGRVLRDAMQMHCEKRDAEKRDAAAPPEQCRARTVVLDPARLVISGFSAGGNIALNLAISVPAMLPMSPEPRHSTSRRNRSSIRASITSPLDLVLPPQRSDTKLDDPSEPWPSMLPAPSAHPRLIPLLLFYPSLDARLLPHERPCKAPLPAPSIGSDTTLNDGKPCPGRPAASEMEKPKVPGLFSIMSPTYLPKKLRAHPRASPGLSNPRRDLAPNAAVFLVLPERDTLAVQSEVWVDKMRGAHWDGPVRTGDSAGGGDKGGGDKGGGDKGGGASDGTAGAKANGGLEVWHAPQCRHGWTQFPESFLDKHERSERDLVFARTLAFVREKWADVLDVSVAEGQECAEQDE